MKRLVLLVLFCSASLMNTSCSNDNPTPTPLEGGGSDTTQVEITKSGDLTTNETWTAGHIYLLDGKVVVKDGQTLTIEPGTIVKGMEGEGSLASALIVERGAKIMAEGTAGKPIIFTSELDNIEVGQKAGSNLGIDDYGLWGGVILLGKAPVSVSGDKTTGHIEGIPADEAYGDFGGTDPNDNSGVLKYVSISHGGIALKPDEEINGLSLGGVGSGTTIDNIEIYATLDDGIEHFGGTVNESNIVIWGQRDDGLDIDESYSGTINNAIVVMTEDAGTGMEIDGPEGSDATADSFVAKNITLVGAGSGSSNLYIDLRDGVLGSLNNILAYNFGQASTVNIKDEDTKTEFVDGNITFSNLEFALPSGRTVDNLLSGKGDNGAVINLNDIDTSIFTNNVTAINSKDEATVGADTSVFGWTFAAQNNAF